MNGLRKSLDLFFFYFYETLSLPVFPDAYVRACVRAKSANIPSYQPRYWTDLILFSTAHESIY